MARPKPQPHATDGKPFYLGVRFTAEYAALLGDLEGGDAAEGEAAADDGEPQAD